MIAEIEMGHLNTIHHQRAVGRIFARLFNLWEEGRIVLEPLPETDIDPGNSESKCPDLILQDNENSTVPLIIEVATNRGWKTDLKKIGKLIDETEYGIEEGFVLDFQKMEWHKYSKNGGVDLENPSWSDVLEIDLISLF